jgi:hypothetical protein
MRLPTIPAAEPSTPASWQLGMVPVSGGSGNTQRTHALRRGRTVSTCPRRPTTPPCTSGVPTSTHASLTR